MDTAAVYWHGIGRKSDTPVYALDTLLAGHTITGPAILIQVLITNILLSVHAKLMIVTRA